MSWQKQEKMSRGMSFQKHYNEKPWNDARIRLIGEYCTKGLDENDEDSIQDVDSLETQYFRFPHPDSTNKLDDDEKTICIELGGYNMDSGQVWSSTGLTVWRASGIMCEYILTNYDDFKKTGRILELGAGLGLCGILVHLITSDSTFVCLTDGDTDTLKQLRNNIQRNLQRDPENLNLSNIIACHQLLWGREDAFTFLEKKCDGTTFDLLFGSDIIYAECILEPLWETVKILLTKQTGIFVTAFSSGRQVGPISKVLNMAEQSGFTYTCVAENKRKCAHDEGVSIYVFKWNEQNI